jgi:hypothetical protein
MSWENVTYALQAAAITGNGYAPLSPASRKISGRASIHNLTSF